MDESENNRPASVRLPESVPGSQADFLPGSAVGDDRLQYVRDVLQDQGDLLQGRVMSALQVEFNSFQESVCAFIALQLGENGLMPSQQLVCVSMEEEEEAAWTTSCESTAEQPAQVKEDETAATMAKLTTLIGMFGNASSILRSIAAQ